MLLPDSATFVPNRNANNDGSDVDVSVLELRDDSGHDEPVRERKKRTRKTNKSETSSNVSSERA